jgi:hypothetical protein
VALHERLLSEVDEVLKRQREREAALTTRATGLLSAAAIVATVAVGLAPDKAKGHLPLWLIAALVAVIFAATIAIAGRELEDPGEYMDWATAWSSWNDVRATHVLMMSRMMAMKVNRERLLTLQRAFWLHSVVVAIAVTASLTYLVRSR